MSRGLQRRDKYPTERVEYQSLWIRARCKR